MMDLEAAAIALDARGDHELAAQARAEAAAVQPAPPAPVAQRCDHCSAIVRGAARISYYAETLGVDWVLCSTCSPWHTR